MTALTATMTLEPDMDSAAISGRSTSPNAGSNTLSYLSLDPSPAHFKSVGIQQLVVTSAGVPNGLPNLNVQPVVPASCDPTHTDPTQPCMAQGVPTGVAAQVRIALVVQDAFQTPDGGSRLGGLHAFVYQALVRL